MASARSVAKKIRQSHKAGGGNWIKQGKGRLIVKAIRDEDLYGGQTFIAELYVEHSESFSDAVDEKGQAEKANAPGSSLTYLQQLDKNPKVAYPNMKAFLYDLLDESDESIDAAARQRIVDGKVPAAWCKEEGKPPSEWTGDDEFGEIYASLVSNAQPCRGMALDFETYRKKTKERGIWITLPRWSHVKQSAAEIKARRAKLDGLEPTPEAAQQ